MVDIRILYKLGQNCSINITSTNSKDTHVQTFWLESRMVFGFGLGSGPRPRPRPKATVFFNMSNAVGLPP